MATIAMQRGSSAYSSATPITLWTQSGGSATKVIFNQLMMFNNAGGTVQGAWQLSYYPSGGYASQIAYLYYPYGGAGSIQFDPVLGSKPQVFYNNNPSYYGPQHGGQWMQSSPGGTTPIGQQNPANNTIVVTTLVFGLGFHVCPPSFYVGPGDSVKFQASSGGSDRIVSWSFTTITE